MYDVIGYQHTYVIMGIVVFFITLFAAFFLKKEDPVQAGEVEGKVASDTDPNTLE
jgi:OHS family lactose permease-like MFS transporter